MLSCVYMENKQLDAGTMQCHYSRCALFTVFRFQAETEICSYIIVIVVLSNSRADYFATSFLKAEKCNFCNETSFLLRPPSSCNPDNFSRL